MTSLITVHGYNFHIRAARGINADDAADAVLTHLSITPERAAELHASDEWEGETELDAAAGRALHDVAGNWHDPNGAWIEVYPCRVV